MADQREEQDTYHLQRFVDAQSPVYANVRTELGRGQKETLDVVHLSTNRGLRVY
jgi:uncharacterized protein (DUF1810 family)